MNEMAKITILSLNAGQALLTAKNLIEYIMNKSPDIVLIQEVSFDHVKKGWPLFNDIYKYQYHGPFVKEDGVLVGMGVVSKFPILSCEDFKPAKESLVNQQKITLQLTENQNIIVYNIHTTFPWFRLKKIIGPIYLPIYDHYCRSKEIKFLMDLLKLEKNPVIMAGDFNLTTKSKDYKLLTSILTDTFKLAGNGQGFTWPAHKNPRGDIPLNIPLARIDYIFCSKDWKVDSTQRLDPSGSDHLPLLSKLSLTKL